MKKKIIIVVLFILIVFLIIFLNYDNILKLRYKIAIKNKNCEKIYNLVEIDKGTYLTKEKYISQCKLKLDTTEIPNILIENHKIQNNLVGIFNNITLYIPSDSDLYLDGKQINNNFVIDDNNIYKAFTFDKMFEGEYTIKYKNSFKEENNNINIKEDNIKSTYEFNNKKALITIINADYCYHCKDLLSFLSSLDNNIFDIKVYNNELPENSMVINKFTSHFNVNFTGYPTVIIGNKYITGFNDELEQKYIDNIYYAFRNEVETIIK